MTYRPARKTYPARKRATSPRANQFAADCRLCGELVPAGAGLLEGYPRNWTVRHRPAEWKGSPVSGRYVAGCPGEADRQNLAGQWGAYASPRCSDDTHAEQVTQMGGCGSCNRDVPVPVPAGSGPAPLQADEDADLAEVSRRAGSKYAYTSTGVRMTMTSRRCVDAPCCGCCD